jgi:hypothetical protein
MMDEGGVAVSVGEVLAVFGGTVVCVADSTLAGLSPAVRTAFIEAAEDASGAVVFVVPDDAYADL